VTSGSRSALDENGEELVSLLREAGTDTVIDVRTVPRSRTNPQFNADVLPDTLGTASIGYRHISRLGGLRGHRKGTGPSPNGFWENPSFRNFADYAMTAEFRTGLAELRSLKVGTHARSCVPKRCGGAATGGSSLTTLSRSASQWCISWVRAISTQPA